MRKTKLFIFPLVLLLVSLACGVSGGDTSEESTLQAISDHVRGTGTAAAAQNLDPDAVAQTSQAQATAFSQGALATQAALSSLGADSQTATAASFAPILADLPKYGVDPSEGRLGWVHPPVTLDASGFRQFEYINYFIGTLATDFVVSVDITWDIVGSIAGCGFVLRSDGNAIALNQYMVILTRVASGHVVFATMSNGEVVTYRDIYARYTDKTFDWQNLSTNRLTVVGRGNRFFIYTNDTLLGEIDPTKPPALPIVPPEPQRPADANNAQAMAEYNQNKAEYDNVMSQINSQYSQRLGAANNADKIFENGFIAMAALSESGRKTQCTFNNGWLFLIE